jgi:Prion-inhibition and propagation
MDPTSFAFGALALASLFSTCVECFEYFGAARSFTKDYDVLLVKLDVQKERLLTWGDLAGVLRTQKEERLHELNKKEALVQRCLDSMQSLFLDASKLESLYGLKTEAGGTPMETPKTLSSYRADLFNRSYARINGQPKTRRNLTQRTKWAIHDKGKFESLIRHVKDLVDGLHNVVPVLAQQQDAMIRQDILALNITELKLVKEACADRYQAWSDVASAILTASDSGTFDYRTTDDLINDTSEESGKGRDVLDEAAPPTPLYAIEKLDISLKPGSYVYFVFTGPCFSLGTPDSCRANTIGPSTFATKGATFLPETEGLISTRWSLGRRITESMQLNFHTDDIEMLRNSNWEVGEYQSEVMNKVLPLGKMYMYCGPCICALRTALVTCHREQSKTIHCLVRVDDRIETSCGDQQSRLSRLVSVIDIIRSIEAMPASDTVKFDTSWTQMVDRIWLEQRIYDLEEELQEKDLMKSRFSRGTELFADLIFPSTSVVAIVVLGELDKCYWMMQQAPFPWSPRMPRENEIYQFKGSGRPLATRWSRTFLGTFTPRNYHITAASHSDSRGSLASSELHAVIRTPSSKVTRNPSGRRSPIPSSGAIETQKIDQRPAQASQEAVNSSLASHHSGSSDDDGDDRHPHRQQTNGGESRRSSG